MRRKSLNDLYHLITAEWPYWFCVVTPDPWNGITPPFHKGVCYPCSGERLYTNIEALDLMRRLNERGLTSRAVGPYDNFTLADEEEADRLLHEIEARDESRQPTTA